jgi:hypothetical protein
MRIAKAWKIYGSVCCVTLTVLIGAVRHAASMRESAQESSQIIEPQIVGPSVMLRLQREKEPVLDLRPGGRQVPGALRVSGKDVEKALVPLLSRSPHTRPRSVALLGDDIPQLVPIARRLRVRFELTDVYLVPAPMLEYHTLPDISQLTPAALRARLPRMRVLDVSEVEEFAARRVPGSRHASFAALWAGDRSMLPHKSLTREQPLALI